MKLSYQISTLGLAGMMLIPFSAISDNPAPQAGIPKGAFDHTLALQ